MAALAITVRRTPALDEALARHLARIPTEFLSAGAPPTDPSAVRALLVGSLERELPSLTPTTFPELRLVQSLFTGVDTVPFDRLGPEVKVAGNVGAYAPFVAEHAVALALAVAKAIPRNDALARSGHLRPVERTLQLAGGRALIVGLGSIGREVARRLSGLGMSVEAVTRDGRPREGAGRSYSPEQLVEAVRGARVIVNCLPLTRRTRGLFGAAVFAAMGPGSIYINVGRAETTEPEPLREWLAREPSSGAGIDVWWHEEFASGRLPEPFPLAPLANLVASPHVAGHGEEATRAGYDSALANLAAFFAGRPVKGVVDRAEYQD
ncbi:MAG TPA: NAD(P)-dependent oxidoreductase [Thermoplasmata archaeon]|nr:NAD(P)-dependent oxidoreductase [Thermoplasmata archaeon]